MVRFKKSLILPVFAAFALIEGQANAMYFGKQLVDASKAVATGTLPVFKNPLSIADNQNTPPSSPSKTDTFGGFFKALSPAGSPVKNDIAPEAKKRSFIIKQPQSVDTPSQARTETFPTTVDVFKDPKSIVDNQNTPPSSPSKTDTFGGFFKALSPAKSPVKTDIAPEAKKRPYRTAFFTSEYKAGVLGEVAKRLKKDIEDYSPSKSDAGIGIIGAGWFSNRGIIETAVEACKKGMPLHLSYGRKIKSEKNTTVGLMKEGVAPILLENGHAKAGYGSSYSFFGSKNCGQNSQLEDGLVFDESKNVREQMQEQAALAEKIGYQPKPTGSPDKTNPVVYSTAKNVILNTPASPIVFNSVETDMTQTMLARMNKEPLKSARVSTMTYNDPELTAGLIDLSSKGTEVQVLVHKAALSGPGRDQLIALQKAGADVRVHPNLHWKSMDVVTETGEKKLIVSTRNATTSNDFNLGVLYSNKALEGNDLYAEIDAENIRNAQKALPLNDALLFYKEPKAKKGLFK